MQVEQPMCLGCRHFHQEGFMLACDAFPVRIPTDILHSKADHRQPFTGDQGIQFAPKTPKDADYAASLFDAKESPES